MAYILYSFTESSKREWHSRTASHLIDSTGGQKWCTGECYSLICPQDTYHLSSLPLAFSKHICWCISKCMPHVIFKESCLCNQREKLSSHYYKTNADRASEFFFLAISQYHSLVMNISMTVIRPHTGIQHNITIASVILLLYIIILFIHILLTHHKTRLFVFIYFFYFH